MWTGLGRAITTGADGGGYLDLLAGLGPSYRPEDTYHATALCLAEALVAGITTVHDWSHNLRGPEWTDAALSAHAESGVRGRLSYGGPQGQPPDLALDLAEVRRARSVWVDSGRAPLTYLGAALRGPDVTPTGVLREEVEAARALGLPITMHAQPRANTGAIKALAAEDLLGPDVQLVHAVYADARDRALMSESGTGLSVSPVSELLFGWGGPQTTQMLDAGVGVSLSVDNTALAGQADLFEVMRLTLGLGATARGVELGLDPRRVLRLATIDGATQLGLGDVTGSLTPGKRADLILVRTDTANTVSGPDPVSTVVRCARPSDVDTVICDGRILKRDGDPIDVDVVALGCAAARSLRRVRSRAGH
jgi:cytosine/adenosine deaminase-related metal-dependent hydrolase